MTVWAAAETASSPWWLALLLGTVPVVGTVLVARAPIWLERAKNRKLPADPPPAAPHLTLAAQAETRADQALDLVEKSLRDAWAERDAAHRRADRLQDELDAEEDKTARQAIELAELRAQLTTRRGRRDT